MRKVLLALILVGAASTSGAVPAATRDYPFCIKGCDFGAGRGDCSFTSYQQCQATASGRAGYCDTNPYYTAYTAYAEPQPNRRPMSRRRF